MISALGQFRINYPATMKKLSAVLALAGIASFAAAAEVVGNAKAAENKVELCIGCHGIPGYKSAFPEVYQVPKIGGQSAKYIESALKAYQKGERKHPSMRGIAASLSDQDIADVAAYYSQQK
jgi:cytochrome c553